MVVGTGSLASIFIDEFQNNSEILIFASGVSDSTEKNKNEFDREKTLLLKTIKQNPDKKIIYFSSIFSQFKKTEYYLHKSEIEKLIIDNCTNFLIIRLPQILSKNGNKKNIINFFVENILNEKKINLFSKSWRAIIDIEDVFEISKELIFNYKNKVLDFSHVEIVTPIELYSKIAKTLNKKEFFEIIDFDENIPQIENCEEVDFILKKKNINFEKYTDKILKKYLKLW